MKSYSNFGVIIVTESLVSGVWHSQAIWCTSDKFIYATKTIDIDYRPLTLSLSILFMQNNTVTQYKDIFLIPEFYSKLHKWNTTPWMNR